MENKRIFVRTISYGTKEKEIIRIDTEDVKKRYFVGDRTIGISLEDNNVEIASDYAKDEELGKYAYADEYADTEAWRYVWEYMNDQGEDEHLAEMTDRLLQVAFDPRDCGEEEYYIRWDGSNHVDVDLTNYSEHDWLEVTEDWEDAEELDSYRDDAGTYYLYKLKDSSRHLIASSRYAGAIDTLYSTTADKAHEALEQVQEAARQRYYQ